MLAFKNCLRQDLHVEHQLLNPFTKSGGPGGGMLWSADVIDQNMTTSMEKGYQVGF